MGNREGAVTGKACVRDLLCGLGGGALYLLLLFAAAIFSDRHTAIMDARTITVKVCLLLSAIVCGVLAGRGAEKGRALHGLLAQSVLLLILGASLILSDGAAGFLSLVIDLVIMLFGAFAGTIGRRNRRRKRRGIR